MSVSHATAQELVRDLLELQRATRRVLKATADQRELTAVQSSILTMLSCMPGRRAKDIVAESNLGASGMSRQLSVLEQLGHVVRTPDPEDGRAQIVGITDSGRRALEADLRADARSLAARLGDLGEDEAVRTSSDLKRLTDLFLASAGMSPMTSGVPVVPPAEGGPHHTPHRSASGIPRRGEENSS